MKYAIEAELRRLFKAKAELDIIKVFSIGEPVFAPTMHYPIVIIFAERRLVFDEEMGIWVYRYTGYVAAETFIQDDYEVEDREMDVTSQLTLRSILDSVTDVMEDNQSLGNLLEGDETVRVIQVGDKTYALRKRNEKSPRPCLRYPPAVSGEGTFPSYTRPPPRPVCKLEFHDACRRQFAEGRPIPPPVPPPNLASITPSPRPVDLGST